MKKINLFYNECNEGTENPLKLAVMIKEYQEQLDSIKDAAKDMIMKELQRNGDSLELENYKISKQQKTTWNYDNSEEIKQFNEKIKNIQKNMQLAASNGQRMIFEETGEVFEMASKTITEFYKIEKKKIKGV